MVIGFIICQTRPAEEPTAKELSLLFLKLGTTAFGGPAAHIAMTEEEVVKRRGWISHANFLDLRGATNLVPGPIEILKYRS